MKKWAGEPGSEEGSGDDADPRDDEPGNEEGAWKGEASEEKSPERRRAGGMSSGGGRSDVLLVPGAVEPAPVLAPVAPAVAQVA